MVTPFLFKLKKRIQHSISTLAMRGYSEQERDYQLSPTYRRCDPSELPSSSTTKYDSLNKNYVIFIGQQSKTDLIAQGNWIQLWTPLTLRDLNENDS